MYHSIIGSLFTYTVSACSHTVVLAHSIATSAQPRPHPRIYTYRRITTYRSRIQPRIPNHDTTSSIYIHSNQKRSRGKKDPLSLPAPLTIANKLQLGCCSCTLSRPSVLYVYHLATSIKSSNASYLFAPAFCASAYTLAPLPLPTHSSWRTITCIPHRCFSNSLR